MNKTKITLAIFTLFLLFGNHAKADIRLLLNTHSWAGDSAHSGYRDFAQPIHYYGYNKNRYRHHGNRYFNKRRFSYKRAPYRNRYGHSSGFNRYHRYYRNNNFRQFRNFRSPSYGYRKY